MSMGKIVVLVVDSSVFIIERWQNILSETENIKTVYGAVAYRDASVLFKEIKPNVVLLDGTLPGSMSIDLLREFKAPNETATVIILANSIDRNIEEKCKSLGADFFFDKYHDFEKIPAFITANAFVAN
jgi:DNA-binding NarL/FixJ family response regulator